MNSFTGHIRSIESSGNLSIVTADVSGTLFTSVVLEKIDDNSYLAEDREVEVHFKETEVVIATGDVSGISLRNRMEGQVRSVDRGKLLSQVKVDTSIGEVVAIITTRAVDLLGLENGTKVCALVKTNEILLSP